MPQKPPEPNPRQRVMLIGGVIGLGVAASLLAWQLWPQPLASPAQAEAVTEEHASPEIASQPIKQQTRAGETATEPERTNYRVAPR